ncbi:hypothetical protein LOAG_11655 [Loa loa]|uniref:Uncharacterized protein n=1 Tax=Loa loa TaxID=7209 RepID=A0A1S0TNU7_LOALO|nr:hypothetical protein LOAG_11655 [Loa loa]EFO16848.2 hypothetical protein LOAG_11655 [Loa loa]
MNETLNELLNLFEDDEQFKVQKSPNVDGGNDRGMKKMDDKQKKDRTNLTISNTISAEKKRKYET